MSNKRTLENCDKVLIVEGYSDLLFYVEVLKHVDRYDGVVIKPFNGRADLLKQLELFLSPELLAEKESVSIIVDADDNAAGIIQSLQSTLKKLTRRDLEHGVWSEGEPKLGFLVVPDGEAPGEVETLAWNAWANDRSNASVKQCIDAFLACMEDHGKTAKSPDKGRRLFRF